jgi:hypothetical protein
MVPARLAPLAGARYEVEEIVAELPGREGSATAPGAPSLAQRLAHTVLVRRRTTATRPTTGCRDAVARLAAGEGPYVGLIWPKRMRPRWGIPG